MHRSWQFIIICLHKATHSQWCVLAVNACKQGFISNACACEVLTFVLIPPPILRKEPSQYTFVVHVRVKCLSLVSAIDPCLHDKFYCYEFLQNGHNCVIDYILFLTFFFTQHCALGSIHDAVFTHADGFWLLDNALKYILSASYTSHPQWCLQFLASTHKIIMNPPGHVSQWSENLFGLYTQSTNLDHRLFQYLIGLNTMYFYIVSNWGFLWYPSCLCFGLRLKLCYFDYYGFCVCLNIC